MLLLSIACLIPACYGIGAFTWSRFGEAVLIYTAMMWCCECEVQLFSVMPSPILGMLAYISCWFVAFLFSGMIIGDDAVFWPLRALCYIFPQRYGLRSMIYLVFIDTEEYSGTEPCAPTTCLRGFWCPEDPVGISCWGSKGEDIVVNSSEACVLLSRKCTPPRASLKLQDAIQGLG